MINENENKMKELMVEIISSEYVDIVSGKGLYFNESITYENRYSHITENEHYPLVEQKLKSIINLINEDTSLVHKDIETELWYMV